MYKGGEYLHGAVLLHGELLEVLQLAQVDSKHRGSLTLQYAMIRIRTFDFGWIWILNSFKKQKNKLNI